jgi:long-chain fatty acid transport protein
MDGLYLSCLRRSSLVMEVLAGRTCDKEKRDYSKDNSVALVFQRNVFLLGLFVLAVIILVSCLTTSVSNASGFALYTSGAAEIAQCGSVIAHTQGAASNYYNPALLPELEGTRIESGTIPLWVSADFTSDATGRKTSMERNTFYPFTLFITHKINERFSAGLGVNSTFGLGTEWPDDWEGRYIATESDLETLNINPNLAWKVSDNVILAAGFNILFGDTVCEQKIDPLLLDPALPDGNSKMTGDGEGYGYNLGLLYKVSDDVAFGISYRSGITLKLKGDVKWTQPGAGILLDTGATVDLDLPAQCFAGVSYRPSKNMIVEIGGKWEGWSSYKNVTIKTDQVILLWGNNENKITKNWKDVYGFNMGIRYNIDPTLSIAAGYLHEGNPVPSETFEPSVPVSDRDDFSFGIQKISGKFKVSLAYLYDKYESRNKNNRVSGYSATGITANGKYEQHVHMVGLSVGYVF